MHKRFLSACALSVMAATAPALAQSTAQPPDEGQIASPDNTDTTFDGTSNDKEIVITAQGRSQVLSDVPIAVSALSSEQLQLSGATDIRAVAQITPSLLVSSTGNEAQAAARVRGIGTVGDNPGLESSVAVFIDGVYRSRTGVGLNDLGEVDRIEVLRGPQGTLFGRNASAGLLNIVTKAPSLSGIGGMAEATYGNYDGWRLQGGLNVPLGSAVALRVDGLYSKRDGFYKDVNTGYDVNNRDRYLVRGQLLFEPTTAIKVRIIGDYSRRTEDCCAAVFLTPDANYPYNNGLITPTSLPVRVVTAITGTSYNQYYPSAGDNYSRRIAISPNRSYAGVTEDYGVSGQIDWTIGNATLTSITGYRRYEAKQGSDADYGLADILYFGPDTGRRFKTLSQELRLRGKAFGNKLDWLIGGYYANEEVDTRSQLNFGDQFGRFATCRLALAVFGAISPDNTACLTPATLGALSLGLAPAFGALGPVVAGGFARLDAVRDVGDNTANFSTRSRNFAFFTHDILHLTDKLDLTLGVRYTNERKRMSASFNNTNTICPTQQAELLPYVPSSRALFGGLIALTCQGNTTSGLNALMLDQTRKESKFTGTAIVSYKPFDNFLVYASYARGYKSGGFNLERSALISPVPTQPLPISPINPANAAGYAASLQFEPETVNSFEFGTKFSSRNFDLNVAAFREEFTNFQLNAFNGTSYLVQNINGCKDDLNNTDRDQSIGPRGPFYTPPTPTSSNPAALTGSCSNTKAGVISQGVEIETSIILAGTIRVNAGLTLADTRYAKNLVGSSSGVPLDPALRLLPGHRVSNAPLMVVTSSVAWTPKLTDSGIIGLFYIDGRLSDDYNTGSDLFPQKLQDSYFVMNARLGIRGPNEFWALEFWSQNLTNAKYLQVGFSAPFQAVATAPVGAQYPAGDQTYGGFLAEPRTYGVTLRTRF